MAEYLMTKYNKEGKFYQADALKHAIDAVPTDGLGITDSDFDQLCPEASRKGSPCDIYNIVDTLLYDYLKHHQNGENDVVLRHEATHFKRINPFNIPRDWIVEKDYDHKLDFGQ